MRRLRFWLVWSWRDLRERWLLVAAIAATIAVGTGAYAGLSSSSTWRKAANDASFAALNMYDLRVAITDGTFLPAGRLAATARLLDGGSLFQQVEERVVVPTQVDASTSDQTILVPGHLIGLPLDGSQPPINGVAVKNGRNLTSADDGKDVAVLEYHFAQHYDLPPQGTIKLPGNVTLNYVGQGLTPEYFIVISDEGALQAEASFAVLVAPLDTVQAAIGESDQVNDLLVKLAPGVDSATAEQALKTSLASAFPQTQFDVMTPNDDPSYSTMYQQIDSDQKFYSIFAIVIMLGATLAAFNLTSRIVEAQRRQIGISMALGVPPRWIAFRPILVGAAGRAPRRRPRDRGRIARRRGHGPDRPAVFPVTGLERTLRARHVRAGGSDRLRAAVRSLPVPGPARGHGAADRGDPDGVHERPGQRISRRSWVV